MDEEEGKLRFEKSSLPKHFTYNPELGNLIIQVCKENDSTRLIMVSQNNRFECCFEVKAAEYQGTTKRLSNPYLTMGDFGAF